MRKLPAILIFFSVLTFSSCKPQGSTEQVSASSKFRATGNIATSLGGDRQDVGVFLVENKRNPQLNDEIVFTLGESYQWGDLFFQEPSISNSYLVELNDQWRPLKKTDLVTGGRAHSFNSARDFQGNLYSSSYFKNSIALSDTKVTTEAEQQNQNQGVFQKIDRQGRLIWFLRIGGTGASSFGSFAIEDDNSVIVYGSYSAGNRLSFSDESFMLLPEGANKFVARFSPSGALRWLFPFKASQFRDMTSHKDEVVLSGYFSGTLEIPGQTPLTSAGSNDVAVLSLKKSGQFSWLKTFGSTGVDTSSCIASDQKNIFISGYASNNPSVDDQVIQSSVRTPFLAKLSDKGQVIQVKSLGDTATNASLEGNCLFIKDEKIKWATFTQGDPNTSSFIAETYSGPQVVLSDYHTADLSLQFVDRIKIPSGSASVFNYRPSRAGHSFLGVYWLGSTIEYRDEFSYENQGAHDLFYAFLK